MTAAPRPIVTEEAPAAIGPYSQATRVGDLLFSSGQIALDPATGELVGGSIEAQTEQVLKNLRAVLAEAGCGPPDVVKATVYLLDLNDFQAMNTIYAAFFGDHKPARSTVQVARLPLDVRVEIDLVAAVPQD